MARRSFTLPSGTYAIHCIAYCGMSWTVGEALSLNEARVELAGILRQRRRHGHPITRLSSSSELPEYECGEPDDCALVPDTAGWIDIVEEHSPAYECADCGDLNFLGDACHCQDVLDAESFGA